MKYYCCGNLIYNLESNACSRTPPFSTSIIILLMFEVCKCNHSFVIVQYIWRILPPSSFSFYWCSLSSMRQQMVVSIVTLAKYTKHLILARQKLISFLATLYSALCCYRLMSFKNKGDRVSALVQVHAQAQTMRQQNLHVI